MVTCKCHDEPMRWIKDKRYRAGGFWRCAVKHRAAHARRQRRYTERLAAADRCTRCGADDPIGAVCWKCLNYMEEHAHALAL